MKENGEKKTSAVKFVRGIFLTMLILVLVAAVGVYIYGMVFFKDHFFLHTTINGFDASQLTAEEVETYMKERC